jgi:predicted protein tyrosine phosphatase
VSQAKADQAIFVFSITDDPSVDLPFICSQGQILRMYFPDTNAPAPEVLEQMSIDVRRALGCAEARQFGPSSALIVHCHAGRSRSSALAWAILVQMGYGIQEAYLHLARLRMGINPNRAVLCIADDHLGLEGQLLAACDGNRGEGWDIEGT